MGPRLQRLLLCGLWVLVALVLLHRDVGVLLSFLLVLAVVIGVVYFLVTGTDEFLGALDRHRERLVARREPIALFTRKRKAMSFLVFALSGAAIGAISGIGLWAYLLKSKDSAPAPPQLPVTPTVVATAPLTSEKEVQRALARIGNEEYRTAVAEVIHAFEPQAFVTIGGSLIGPDGATTVDVQVVSHTGGAPVLVDVIDRIGRGPAGIDVVHVAESKGRDLRAKSMLVCSNTGFDDAAIRKAKRTGVGLITVLKQGDSRATAYVEEEIYLRTIVIKQSRTEYEHPSKKKSTFAFGDITYKGQTVDEWLNTKALTALMGVFETGVVKIYYRLKAPTDFNAPGRKLRSVTQIAMVLDLEIQWAAQTIQIEANSAIYDYIRGALRLSGPKNQYTIKNLNFDTAASLAEPPPMDRLGVGSTPPQPGEVDFVYVRMRGVVREPKPPSPLVTALINPEDLASDPQPIPIRKRP